MTMLVSLLSYSWLLTPRVLAYAEGPEFVLERGEQMLDKDDTLEHYVIQITQGQEVTLQCTSPESETVLVNENDTTVKCKVRQDITFIEYVGDITVSCLLNVKYREEVQWFSCYLKDFPNSKTVIRVSVIPDKGACSTRNTTDVDASKVLFWWCLSDRKYPIYKPSAGHLLYFRWFYAAADETLELVKLGNKTNEPLVKVRKEGLWMKERDDTFICNCSIYRISGEFDCFGRLPTGLPSMQHCHRWSKAGVVILEVLIYILLYTALVVLYKSVKWINRASKGLSSGSAINKGHHGNYPMLMPKCKGRPYALIDDRKKLILTSLNKTEEPCSLSRPTLLQESKESNK